MHALNKHGLFSSSLVRHSFSKLIIMASYLESFAHNAHCPKANVFNLRKCQW